jgi:hypothetical protein
VRCMSEVVVNLHDLNNKTTDTFLGGRSPNLGEPRKICVC